MAQVNTTALGAVKGAGTVDVLKKRRSMLGILIPQLGDVLYPLILRSGVFAASRRMRPPPEPSSAGQQGTRHDHGFGICRVRIIGA